MDAAELLSTAWKAVVASGVPDEMQGIAFKAALDAIQAETPSTATPAAATPVKSKKSPKPSPSRSAPAPAGGSSGDESGVLGDVGAADEFFSSIAHETGVSEQQLRDIFHVEAGAVELKVAAKDLGSNNKAKTTAIATLLAGAVFGGTSHQRLPFSEVHEVCRLKRCFDSGNASSYLKALAGFAPVGNAKAQALTPRSGWEKEFEKAVGQVLGTTPEG